MAYFSSLSFMKKLILIAFVVAILVFTINYILHPEQVSVTYQVYDLEQLRLKEHDPEYRDAASRIDSDVCGHLLSPCEPYFAFRAPLFGAWSTESWQAFLAELKEREKDPNVLWPSFKVGSWVHLCAESGRTYKSRSIDSFGPFQIIEKVVVGNGTTEKYNYKLDIPSQLNYLHPVFHGSMLREENNPGANRDVRLPHYESDYCRIFRPEELNNTTLDNAKAHRGDSFMSLVSSILQKYIFGNVRAAVKLILRI